jgi:hypothetical protein
VIAYFRLGRIDAQVICDSADRRCMIDGVEEISKYQLQAPLFRELIPLMQRHPSLPSIRRLFRAEIEKNLRDPTHPQHKAFQKEFAKCQMGGAQ